MIFFQEFFDIRLFYAIDCILLHQTLTVFTF